MPWLRLTGAPGVDSSESRRADNILASDPMRAYAEQAESLNRRLGDLKAIDLQNGQA